MSARLVSLIGPLASGKTTVAELLAAELPAELIREDYAGNPFLAASYDGQPAARLPGQLYFLMSRAGQLSAASWPGEGVRVSDYGYCQDRVFAELLLGADDLRLYERVARRVDGLVEPPAVLVNLDAPVAVLRERIARRGRGYEKAITDEFLAAMRQRYNAVASALPCPVIHVDTAQVDLREPAGRAGLLAEIRTYLR